MRLVLPAILAAALVAAPATAGVMQLVDDGLVSVDDRVTEHLPEYGLDQRITVRMLLQHTSGLHNYTDELALLDQESYTEHRFDRYTPEKLVTMALAEPPEFAPGDGWSYSNTNCGTLAWGHNGDIPGFSTRLAFTPDGGKGVVMAQTTLTGGGSAEELSDRAIDRVVCG